MVTGRDGPTSQPSRGDHLIIYDGVCGLCNRLNTFVLPRDRRTVFDFASLQSAVGRSVLQRFGEDATELTTFYVLVNYRSASPTLLSRAAAALFLMETLGMPWRSAGLLRMLPMRWLDRLYDLVARHRYRLFGRSDSCPIPRPEYRHRFLDT